MLRQPRMCVVRTCTLFAHRNDAHTHTDALIRLNLPGISLDECARRPDFKHRLVEIFLWRLHIESPLRIGQSAERVGAGQQNCFFVHLDYSSARVSDAEKY
ncbi:hypothetical protein CCL07_00690 [Pseudomonas congelans]|nr:hypothetical protein CCL07_00690 [Pseudomonas congelans]